MYDSNKMAKNLKIKYQLSHRIHIQIIIKDKLIHKRTQKYQNKWPSQNMQQSGRIVNCFKKIINKYLKVIFYHRKI